MLIIFSSFISNAQNEIPIHFDKNLNFDSTKLSNRQIEWLNEQVIAIKNHSDFLISEPEMNTSPNFINTSFRIKPFSIIKFSSGIEIKLNHHSNHVNPDVGDLTIAITSDGIVYYNLGHVCGGMIHFESKTVMPPHNPKDFFETFVSDTDNKAWILYQK